MLPKITPKLTAAQALQVIEDGRNAELCRDTESLQKILQDLWIVEDQPNFDGYDEVIKAELLRLCGVALSLHGKYTLNRKNYQIRGKDILTNAIDIFEANNVPDKAAEAKINLAFCYWNLGEVDECEAILNVVEAEFGRNLLHPVYLQICINRLLIHFWNQDFESGLKIIEEINSAMQLCGDARLQSMFHNKAGIFYRASKQYDRAIFHMTEAIRFAEKTGNQLFVAIELNNLAFLHNEITDFEKAFECISKSIQKVEKIGHKGFLPHALDTKALIYLDGNRPEEALEIIDQSIEYFGKGEDYRGLTGALWTKIRCLLRLGRQEDAFVEFAELGHLAGRFMGENAARKFAKNLTGEIYALQRLPFADEVAEFKKARVREALIEAKGVVGKAAQILQLKNHQALSEILNKQFPELLGELGFRRRARRTQGKTQKAQTPTANKTAFAAEPKREISRLILHNKDFSFDFKVPSDKFETFYFDAQAMQSFGVETDAVVAVIRVAEPKEGMIVLISNENGFSIGRTEFDRWARVYFVSDANGAPVPLDEKNVVGEPIGFSPFSEADKKYIRFSRLG